MDHFTFQKFFMKAYKYWQQISLAAKNTPISHCFSWYSVSQLVESRLYPIVGQPHKDFTEYNVCNCRRRRRTMRKQCFRHTSFFKRTIMGFLTFRTDQNFLHVMDPFHNSRCDSDLFSDKFMGHGNHFGITPITATFCFW